MTYVGGGRVTLVEVDKSAGGTVSTCVTLTAAVARADRSSPFLLIFRIKCGILPTESKETLYEHQTHMC